jgi:hypothetical protein
VHDALVVRRRQGPRHLRRQFDRRAHRQPSAGEARAECLAFEQLRDDVRAVRRAARADIEDRQDVRVVERGGGPRLLLEPRQTVGVGGGFRGDDLDRHLAAQAGITRPVHLL